MILIDADAAVKLIQIATAKELYEGELTKRLGNSYNYHAIAAGYKAAIDDMTQAVKDVPTIDAVPVVRCKDCEYWMYEYDDVGLCAVDVPDTDGVERHAFDFCAYGERKRRC